MKWIALVLGLAACSDDLHPPPRVEAHSGARLAVGYFRFDDGRFGDTGGDLVAPGELYDELAHVRCAPGVWIDGETRCVPIADEAFYSDATCETFIGRGDTDAHPTAFVGYEDEDGVRRPAHLLRAGAAVAAPDGIYRKRDGMCVGPELTDPSITYFAVPGEYEDAVAFGVAERVDDTLAIELTTATDGASMIDGLRDVALDAPCTLDPLHRCAPAAAAVNYFADAACEEPAVVAPITGPAVAAVPRNDGCPDYFAAGAPLAQVFTRSGVACRAVPPSPSLHAFRLGPRLDVPQLAATTEDAPHRRIQRIELSDGQQRLFDARAHDTTLGIDCVPQMVGDTWRCMPERVAGTQTFLARGCLDPLVVAAVPAVRCAPFDFVQVQGDDGPVIHVVGGPVTAYVGTPFSCAPYLPPAGVELHEVGHELDPDAFAAAIYYTAR